MNARDRYSAKPYVSLSISPQFHLFTHYSLPSNFLLSCILLTGVLPAKVRGPDAHDVVTSPELSIDVAASSCKMCYADRDVSVKAAVNIV